jgi:hypothetical protein
MLIIYIQDFTSSTKIYTLSRESESPHNNAGLNVDGDDAEAT